MSSPSSSSASQSLPPVVPAWAMAAAAGLAALVFTWFVHRGLQEKPHESEHFASAHSAMGTLLFQQGRNEEATAQFRHAIELKKDHVEAMNNLGNTLLHQGMWDEAVASYHQAIKIRPDYAEAHNNLGLALIQKTRLDEAIGQFYAALDLRPDYADAENNLGYALLQKGRYKDAEPHFRTAVRLTPANAQCHHNLALSLFGQGQVKEAITSYQNAIDASPSLIGSINNLAWLLATTTDEKLRDGPRALTLARRAGELSGGHNAVVLHTLAAAYAESGSFQEAIQAARQAVEQASAENNTQLQEAIRQQLADYEAGRPYREAAP